MLTRIKNLEEHISLQLLMLYEGENLKNTLIMFWSTFEEYFLGN